MAKIYIIEGTHLAKDSNGDTVMVMKMPAPKIQAVPFSTSTQSAAFIEGTRFIRLWSDTDCFIGFGANPTAVSGTSIPMTAKMPEYWAVQAGDKVAAVI